jgi:uncharacterized membrane protein YccF (DUF307 family)
MKKFFQVLGNILWFIIGGLWFGISYFLLGVIFCITIIGIPVGLTLFKIAKFMIWPFGKDVKVDFKKHPVGNVIWTIIFGWEMCAGYVLAGVVLCITIIGIPLGVKLFQLIPLAFFPFGAEVVKAAD